MSGRIAFTRPDPLGEFTLRPVDPATDSPLLHRWLTHPKSAFWLLQDATLAQVRQQFAALMADPMQTALLGFCDGEPAFLMERYDPARELAGHYPARPGDVGMHFLVAPTRHPRHGFTRAVIITVMSLLFAEPATQRVVVEPDVRNTAVHALNAYVGFQVLDTVTLPGKTAYLSVCTRDQFFATHPKTHPQTHEGA